MILNGILNSWKEIAAYVRRSERTIQRWEAHYGFPIHRPSRRKKGAVIALAAEIDEWIKHLPAAEAQTHKGKRGKNAKRKT